MSEMVVPQCRPSTNTTMLGWLLERATKQSLTAYTSERLWKPLGAEASAYGMVDGPDVSARPLNGMGFNAVLRDYGRHSEMDPR